MFLGLSVLALGATAGGGGACDGASVSPADGGGGTMDAGPTDGGGGKDAKAQDAGPNSAPELARIGDRIVAVGEPLIITLEASDADGDALTYSVYGKLPKGARFIKPERRFEWTPEEAGKTVFLTFVVSDGKEFDRETVRIEVVADKGAHPPKLEVLGDQTVTAGQPFELLLHATDPDGDAVTYGHDGQLPEGATLDASTGRFAWTPGAALAGTTHRVTFTASDGALSASMEVSFVVVGGGGGGPEPPVFHAVPAQAVAVGELLTLTLEAVDPNGDTVTFGVYSGTPDGAALNGATFTYTPQAAQAGMVFNVTFSATDGTFTAYETVDIQVKKEVPAGTCADDPGEPNGDLATATLVEPGTYERTLCDSALVPLDVDFYKVVVPAAKSLTATITFAPDDGDLDLFLADAQGAVLATSETVNPTEQVTWAVSQESALYVIVTGVGQEVFHMGYTLTVAVEDTAACQDDPAEDNDLPQDAKILPGDSVQGAICPGDADWWKLPLTCGEKVTVTLDTGGTGDLDVGLWVPGDASGDPLASSASEDPIETFTVDAVPESGDYPLLVVGYPASVGQGTYSLGVTRSGGCQDDGTAGASAAAAATMEGESGSFQALALCCTDDWFAATLGEGDQLLVDVSVSGAGAAGLTFFAPDGTTQVAAEAPAPTGAIAQATAAVAGTYAVKVTGAVGTSYSLEWLVSPAPAGPCDALSCPLGEVCDDATGACRTDYCFAPEDCPAGYECRDTYCVNPCASGDDCRAGYACKYFLDGRFCGVTGAGAAGAACFSHAGCADEAVCALQDDKGYCAVRGCLEYDAPCPAGTECTLDANTDSLCGLLCQSDTDCRQDDGYVCTPPEDTCLPQ